MFAKVMVIFGVIAAARAGGLYGSTAIGYASGLGYAGGYGSGQYGLSPYSGLAAPIVKTLAPVAYEAPIAYAPAVSSVAQYSIHQAPIVKTYAPAAYSPYASPYLSGYTGYSGYAPAVSYSNYNNYGYSGYGSKYVW